MKSWVASGRFSHIERKEVVRKKIYVTLLQMAIRAQRIDRMDWLLAHGVSLASSLYMPLFQIAAELNNTAIATRLVDDGMPLDAAVLMPTLCRLVDRGHSDFITWMMTRGLDLYTPIECTCYHSRAHPPAEAYEPPAEPFAGSHARGPPYRQSIIPERPATLNLAYHTPQPPADVLCSLAMVDHHWDMVRYWAGNGATVHTLPLQWACAVAAIPFTPTPDAVAALRTGNTFNMHVNGVTT